MPGIIAVRDHLGIGLGHACVVVEPDRLTAAVATAEKPAIVIARQCSSCAGTLSALNDPGIVWFDAHGDFNTPETSASGSIDGMSLAIATGHCYPQLMPHPVKEENAVLVGTRDLDPLEALRLGESRVRMIGLDDLQAVLEGMPREIYLHIDMDVLDPKISPGVNFTGPRGLTPDQLYNAVRQVMASGKLAAVTIANFVPEKDREGRTLKIGQELVRILMSS